MSPSTLVCAAVACTRALYLIPLKPVLQTIGVIHEGENENSAREERRSQQDAIDDPKDGVVVVHAQLSTDVQGTRNTAVGSVA